jgi:serine/threonine protein kinase
VEWKLKIADFGLAKTINYSQSHITVTCAGVGTETWIPPEGFGKHEDVQGQSKTSRTFSYDVHPCGSLLHYILSGGVHAFPGKHIGDMERNLRIGKCRSKIVFKERIDEGTCADMLEAVHLIGKMLEVEPNRRPTMEVVLGHPFFMKPTDKLNVIRRNRDNSWNWCQGKSFCDSRNPKNDDWRKLKKFKKLLNLKIKQSSYRKQLPELARFIRNVREHLFDGDGGTETTTTLAEAMGLSLIGHQDSVEADAKVVQYFSDAEPSIFIQLLPWSPLK